MKKILLITLLTVLTLASTVFAEGGDITGTSSVTTEPVKGETVA